MSKTVTEESVTIRIPVLPTDEGAGDVFVSVNDRTYQIKRGVSVTVPWNVAEVIRQSEEMTLRAIEYISTLKGAK
jgi:mannose-6-phosphate isomerase-like protein (cupin superfamily)